MLLLKMQHRLEKQGDRAIPEKPALIQNVSPSSSAAPSSSEAWQQEDEVNRAAKSVAQMFNGQIVDLEESLQPVPEAVLPTPADVVEPEVDTDDADDDDDDVPF